MSELNPTPEELVENIDMEVEDASVIPVPVDPTLSNEGEAADAKATGDAIAAIVAVKKVNSTSPDNTGNVQIYANNIPMSNAVGAQTVAEAMVSVQAQTGDVIKYETGETDTIKTVVDGVITACTDGCTYDEIDGIFDGWEE